MACYFIIYQRIYILSEISINIFTENVRFEILEITPTLLTLKHQELDIELEFENSITA